MNNSQVEREGWCNYGGEKMARTKKSKEVLAKEKRIKAEKAKLLAIFAEMDEAGKSSVGGLVDNAAFMIVELTDLRDDLAENGYSEEYQNGANQYGRKRRTEADIYLQMSKNFMTIMKQLTDRLPKEQAQRIEEDGFESFLSKRDDLM